MIHHYVEIALYLLAIVLASYALWERFPSGTHAAQKLALAGALLTLFLTYFETSLRIDEIKDAIDALHKEVNASTQDLKLRTLKDATDPAGESLFELLTQESKNLWLLRENGDTTLSEDEGVQLIGKIVEKLALKGGADGLQISAISINPEEFKETPIIKGYEEALEKAVGKMGKVERIYVLPDEAWQKVPPTWSQQETKPWAIEEGLRAMDLSAVASHYTHGIQCILAPPLRGIKNPTEYDLILVTKESNVILGANRVTEGQLRVVWNNPENPAPNRPETTQKWLGAFKYLKNQPNLIRLPEYKQPPFHDNKF